MNIVSNAPLTKIAFRLDRVCNTSILGTQTLAFHVSLRFHHLNSRLRVSLLHCLSLSLFFVLQLNLSMGVSWHVINPLTLGYDLLSFSWVQISCGKRSKCASFACSRDVIRHLGHLLINFFLICHAAPVLEISRQDAYFSSAVITVIDSFSHDIMGVPRYTSDRVVIETFVLINLVIVISCRHVTSRFGPKASLTGGDGSPRLDIYFSVEIFCLSGIPRKTKLEHATIRLDNLVPTHLCIHVAAALFLHLFFGFDPPICGANVAEENRRRIVSYKFSCKLISEEFLPGYHVLGFLDGEW
mmetsp:Transcript_22529/g.54952  ORF Transcript_22529/g.54952 Transcript_22529/m.54952 type:complete len:299 (-) Transcript_22529:412-1308(-)